MKDVLTVVDDFHPSQKNDEYVMKGTMQTLLRTFGNRTGRERLKSDSTPMESRPPKGNAIFTAEFLPDVGESGTARYIPLELNPTSINNDMLTYYQHYASEGILSACMFNYTEWIKDKYLSDDSEFVKLLGDKFVNTRMKLDKLLAEKGLIIRDRLIEDLASLYLGYEFMLDFFVEKNVCEKKSKDFFECNFCFAYLVINIRFCNFAVFYFKLLNTLSNQIDNLSVYGTTFILCNILYLTMQSRFDFNSEMFVIFVPHNFLSQILN